MASIRRRQGKWQVQVRRQGFKAVSRTFNQYKDAERWGLLEERRLDDLESRGLSQAIACGLTVAELLKRYRETVVPLKRGSAVEEYIIRALERASFAATKADRLSVPALLEWRAQRLKLVAASTFQRELGILGHAFEVARREWGFLALRNPVRDVPKLRLPPGRSRRLPDWGLIAKHCPFVRYCVENAEHLSYPEWFAVLGIAARCEGGAGIAHDLSSKDPRYTASETDAKIAEVLKADGPVTYTYIREQLGFDGIEADILASRMTSPIQFGFSSEALILLQRTYAYDLSSERFYDLETLL